MKQNPLTLDKLANLYDKYHNSKNAMTIPIRLVIEWAESRTDLFGIDPIDDTFYIKEQS